MSIDWWTLALQALNVLILVWLLGRFFWKPVSEVIAQRQQAQAQLLAQAQAERDAAQALRAGLEQEARQAQGLREQARAQARADAEQLGQGLREQARRDAQALLDEARADIARQLDAGQRELAQHAAGLALRMAQRLLGRVQAPCVQQAMCAGLERALRELPPHMLAGARDADAVDIVSAQEPDDAQRRQCAATLAELLGRPVTLRWQVDAQLLAGVELQAGSLVVRNSWRADLRQLEQELAAELAQERAHG